MTDAISTHSLTQREREIVTIQLLAQIAETLLIMLASPQRSLNKLWETAFAHGVSGDDLQAILDGAPGDREEEIIRRIMDKALNPNAETQ